MRFPLHHFAAISLAIGLSVGLTAQTPAPAAGPAIKPAVAAAAAPVGQPKTLIEVTNPVADPKAVVTQGNARFTVLTPELIRMEWAMDGKFEDHASFVFLNRRLPVPKFEKTLSKDGRDTLTIKTDALTLVYTAQPDGKPLPPFAYSLRAENLSITLTVDGKQVVWHPGDTDPENLQGTTRTLDGALGSKTKEPIEQGLVSRSGWAVVDDSTRPLFDSADFSFKRRRKEPLAVGHGAARRRAAGLLLLRLRTRLPQGAGRLCAGGWAHSAAAALCLRRMVVALLGL